MHLRADRLTRITVSAALAVGLALGSNAVATPAQAEHVGVPVPAFRGGVVVGWGDNGAGQTAVPTSLSGQIVTAVAAGGTHSLALTSGGQVTAWGDPDFGKTAVPAGLAGKMVTAIAAGNDHSLALTSDGIVTAWGNNDEGQVTVPSGLAGKTVLAIAAGSKHSLALTSDGTIAAWGRADEGQAAVPPVLSGETVTAIAAGAYHSLALTSDGNVAAWGANFQGQVEVPETLEGKTVTAIAAGGDHSLVLAGDGKVTAWGEDEIGQATVPASLAGKIVTAIAAGTGHSLAVADDGTVTGWGYLPATTLPLEVTSRVITAVAAGRDHSLAISTTFAAERAPVVSGSPQVGGILTGEGGRYTATPASLGYQWYADGVAIPGANARTLVVAPSQRGKRITVQVSATLTGHTPVVTTSGPTGPVLGVPTIRFAAAKSTIRRGRATTLTWSSTDAATLTAAGAWTGGRGVSGSIQVKPKTLGTTTYVLSATNVLGTTTAQVQVKVIRPAARLKVTAPKGDHRPGAKVKVKVRGLEAGERYTIRVGKRQVAVGTAKNARPITTKIKLPKKTGKAIVRVSGDQPDRTGAAKLRVVRR